MRPASEVLAIPPTEWAGRGGFKAEQFRTLFRRHPAGVVVITLCSRGRPYGFTATSVISVSADPPLVAFSVADRSTAWTVISRASSLALNFLAADQAAVADRFAARSVDRFQGLTWSALPTGEPVLAGVSSWLRGEVQQRIPAGESHLIVLRALQAHEHPESAPLLYLDRRYHPG